MPIDTSNGGDARSGSVSWPVAAVVIAAIAAFALVVVAALQVLGADLARQATTRRKLRELAAEAEIALKEAERSHLTEHGASDS